MKTSSDKWKNLIPAPDWPCSLVTASCLLLLQSVNSWPLLLIVHRLHLVCTDLCTEALGDWLGLVGGISECEETTSLIPGI